MRQQQSRLRRVSLSRRLALGGSVAALVGMASLVTGAGASASVASQGSTAKASTSCAAGATKLVFWAWVPGISRAVNAYNASQKKVCVQLEDEGAGGPEYVKLANAIKAGSGAPDVAEVEYDELPSFEITHSVVNLAKYGADKYKSDFVPWVWSEVSQGPAVYAMPGDSGPMAFYYNSVQLAKYKITPPTTWAQFATDAATLKKDDPSAYFTNFSATDLQWVVALMAQDNAFPFKYTGGSNVTVDFTGPAQKAFADYWQKLISAKEVNDTTDVDVTSFADMDKGTDASWLSSAWGPSYMAADVKATTGDWRASALPQWKAGEQVAANWGGSSYPVFTQSKHPAQAAAFSEWLNGTLASWNITKTAPSSLFPTFKPLLNSTSFKDLTVPLSGSTHPDVVFSAAGADATAVEWPPFMTEALTVEPTLMASVVSGKETLYQGFESLQSALVKYAKSEGFTVTT